MRPLLALPPATLFGKALALGVGVMFAAAITVGGSGRPASAARAVDQGVVPAANFGRALSGSGRPVAYRAPVPLPLQVARAFSPPLNPYGPGHLGVDLAVTGSAHIRSAGPGIVSFAGPVAGRGVIVVDHPDGVRTEYEPVRPLVRRGDAVRAGTVIGVLAGRHPGCPVPECLHWGARRGDGYIDPLGLLAPLGPVRLLPWDS